MFAIFDPTTFPIIIAVSFFTKQVAVKLKKILNVYYCNNRMEYMKMKTTQLESMEKNALKL